MKNIRIPIKNSLRVSIFARDGFTCHYCGRRAPDVVLHVEHIIAVNQGGTNHPSNLVTACTDCNYGKGRRSLIVEELLKKPSESGPDPLDFVPGVLSRAVDPPPPMEPEKWATYSEWIRDAVEDAHDVAFDTFWRECLDFDAWCEEGDVQEFKFIPGEGYVLFDE